MTPAEQAIANAIQCEMVKYAYRQTKDGVVVSFVVHPDDMPAELATAPIGARFVSALVHVGDDELPVRKPAKEGKATAARNPATPRQLDKPAGAKRDWRDVDPTTQAGIRCNEPVFAAFLSEKYVAAWRELQDAAEVVRSVCGINSRKQISADQRARVLWHQLDEQFQAWKALEHA